MSHDSVNHPTHYTSHVSGVECIDLTENLGFCLGNAIKYVFRHREKGTPAEDLRKARWYVDREIKRRLDLDLRLTQPPLSLPGEFQRMDEKGLMAKVAGTESGDVRDALVCLWQAAINRFDIEELRQARWYIANSIRRLEKPA